MTGIRDPIRAKRRCNLTRFGTSRGDEGFTSLRSVDALRFRLISKTKTFFSLSAFGIPSFYIFVRLSGLGF
uniref:Uncharacterized protein n=1 Tax=candidate division WOR-3 bacterium TaxID=2052148 RepID=A0A7C6A8S0_UNCW3